MAIYFAVRWLHDRDDDPVMLYEELDDARQETRKVHEYRDGRLIRTDTVNDTPDSLSWAEVPSTDEIDADSDFTVLPLSPDGFQAAWDRALDAE